MARFITIHQHWTRHWLISPCNTNHWIVLDQFFVDHSNSMVLSTSNHFPSKSEEFSWPGCLATYKDIEKKCDNSSRANLIHIPNKKAMLREHKPPPIRRIRISDFGLPDPKRDPDRHQNCITWSLSHALPLQKVSSKSVHKFASNLTDRQTNRQTDWQTDRQTDKQTAPKT